MEEWQKENNKQFKFIVRDALIDIPEEFYNAVDVENKEILVSEIRKKVKITINLINEKEINNLE